MEPFPSRRWQPQWENRMSEHLATIRWGRGDFAFAGGKFSRVHSWAFDGGLKVEAAASPGIVPAAYNSTTAVDPEEALVASISSCHMLTFLHLASKGGFVVDSYEDNAVGTMVKNDHGSFWVSTVTLRPNIAFSGDKRPSSEDLAHLHHNAHEMCFIANSVKCEIKVEPVA
jgi:organic hydroperoxide reductase OsmC/OhrA